MRKRFFDHNLNIYTLRVLKASLIPTNSTIAVILNTIMRYIRLLKAEILFWDNHHNCDTRKQGFADNTKTESDSNLEIANIPTYLNSILGYLRLSEVKMLYRDNCPHRDKHANIF